MLLVLSSQKNKCHATKTLSVTDDICRSGVVNASCIAVLECRQKQSWQRSHVWFNHREQNTMRPSWKSNLQLIHNRLPVGTLVAQVNSHYTFALLLFNFQPDIIVILGPWQTLHCVPLHTVSSFCHQNEPQRSSQIFPFAYPFCSTLDEKSMFSLHFIHHPQILATLP